MGRSGRRDGMSARPPLDEDDARNGYGQHAEAHQAKEGGRPNDGDAKSHVDIPSEFRSDVGHHFEPNHRHVHPFRLLHRAEKEK